MLRIILVDSPVPAKLTFLFLLLDLVGFPPSREILRADGGDTVLLGDTPSSDPELHYIIGNDERHKRFFQN